MSKTFICLMVLACFTEVGFCLPMDGQAQPSIPSTKTKVKKIPVEIVLNGIEFSSLLIQRSGELYIKTEDLVSAGVRKDAFSLEEVSLIALDPNLKFDQGQSRVVLTIPASLFPETTGKLGYVQPYKRLNSQFGAWLNYDSRVQSVAGRTGFQAYLDGTVSTKWGLLRSQHVFNSLALTAEERFKRIATYLQRSDEEGRRTTILGDTYSLPGTWGTPVNFGGIRIARDFTLNPPGFLVNPNYTIKGEALTPSVVEVWEGGQRTYSERRDPGPFSISNYVPIKNGMAQVVVRDQYGNATTQEVALYSTPQHLADGLDAYSIEAGLLKRDGIYSEAYFGAGYRRGFDFGRIFGGVPLLEYASSIFPVTTLEGRVEGMKGDIRLGGGASVSSWFGNLTVSGAVGQKKDQEGVTGYAQAATTSGNSGAAVSVAPSISEINRDAGKQPSIWQINFDRPFEVKSIKGNVFGLITKPTNWIPIGGSGLMRPSNMLGLSIVPSERASLSFVGTTSGDSSDKHSSKTLSLSYVLERNVTGYLSLTKSDQNSVAMLSVSYSFDKGGSVYATATKENQSLSYTGHLLDPMDNLTVNVGRDQSSTRFDGSYATDISIGRLSAAVSQSNNQTGYRAGMAGSLLFSDWNLSVGRSLNDAVVLVQSDIPNLPISLNRQPVGYTDDAGQLMLTVPAGKINTVEVNGNLLAAGYEVNDRSSETVYQRQGDVAKVSLSANRPGWKAFFTVNGRPVPKGQVVFINDSRFISTSKGIHAENMPFGKVVVRIDRCQQELEIPQGSSKKIPVFNFDIVCKGDEK